MSAPVFVCAGSPRSRQKGFNLVEVMIALTIGLVLMVGLLTMFSSLRQTSKDTEQMSYLQNNERMAMYFLRTAITSAGYDPNPPNAAGATNFGATVILTGTAVAPVTTGAGQQTMSVSFIADNTVRTNFQGCTGATLTAGDVYTDTFQFVTLNPASPIGYLQCQEQDITAGAAATIVNLIGNITGLNFQYGVDTTGSGSVNQYLTANDVTSWPSVKTVNVTLYFTNPTDPTAVNLGNFPYQYPSFPATIPVMASI